MGRVSRRQRQPRPLRRAQARRPAHPVRQAGRRRRQGARSLRRPSRIPTRCCSSRCRSSTARRSRRRGSRRSPDAGVAIAVYPLERDALPAWIAARLARQRQRVAPETLAFLADRCEGNLLAARQEIEKLGLLLPEGELGARRRRARGDRRRPLRRLPAVGSVARGRRRARAAHHRRARSRRRRHPAAAVAARRGHPRAGVGAARRSRRERRSPSRSATRASGASGRRRWSAPRAACRPTRSRRCCRALARLDALAKGIGRGNVWDELRTAALTLAGKPLPLSPVAGTGAETAGTDAEDRGAAAIRASQSRRRGIAGRAPLEQRARDHRRAARVVRDHPPARAVALHRHEAEAVRRDQARDHGAGHGRRARRQRRAAAACRSSRRRCRKRTAPAAASRS